MTETYMEDSMQTKLSQKRRDPRHDARLTGSKPLSYDRHGDAIAPEHETEHDPLGLVGGRWLARSITLEGRR